MNKVVSLEELEEIKTEEMENMDVKIEDFDHSIVIEEEASTNESQVEQDCETQIYKQAKRGSMNLKHNRDKQELFTLLKSWKLEHLHDHLVAEQVFVHILKIIKRHHLKDLLSQRVTLGTRILFEHSLEEWRASIGMPLSDISPHQSCDTSSRPPSPAPSRIACQSQNAPAPPPTPHYVPYTVPSSPTSEKYVMLSTILNETSKGTKLTEYYKKFSKFEDEQRTLLIAAVALYFDENDIHLSLPTSYRLENEILQLFPTEKLEFYRTCKRGKIYNKYCNSKKSFKAAVSQHVMPQTQKSGLNLSHLKVLVPEQDAESCIRALKYENLTGDEFDSTWKGCAQFRLQAIREETTTSGILEKWPQYKASSGVRLIDMDFGILFETGNKLVAKWKTCREKLLEFLLKESNVKDKAVKAILKTVNEGNLPENSQDAAIFWALHGYFVPTHKIVKKDVMGNKNTVKFAIKDSQESFMYIGRSHDQLEEHLTCLKRKRESIQPFILCVGEDVTAIKEIYVYFDGIKFSFASFLRAVDICLKIFFVFNVHFPIEAVTFWNFIQTYFYEINSTKSYSKVHVLLEELRSEEV